MITLFIDSSRKSLSVALSKDSKLLFISNVNSYSKHSNFLMNEIINILNKAGITVNEIDNIVILNGPGSFTGIRVGVTIAKTLAWSLSKKIYTLNNLEALKVGIESDYVISIIYDKDKDSYVGIYSNKSKIEGYISLENNILNIKNKNITIVSMDENAYVINLKDKLLRLNNKVNIKILKDYDYINVINYALSNNNINPHLACPIYLKKIDAEKNKNGN